MAQAKKTAKAKEQKVEEPEVEETEQEEGKDGELFPGGPTQEWVDDMKEKVGGELFMTRILDEVFIWRPLKRSEYREIMKVDGADALYKEEKVCTKCTLWPENKNIFRTGGAGYATVLNNYIYEESGFTTDVTQIQL